MSPALDGTDPYVPGHGDASFDVGHYDLTVRYKLAGNRLDGEATLHCVARDELSSFRLDLHGLRPAKVTLESRKVHRFSHETGHLTIRLAAPVSAGEEFTVRVKYAGKPACVHSKALGEAGWEELHDGVIVASQPHGAPSWFPCNDRPDNKATYTFTIAAPHDYHVAVSGELTGTTRHPASTEWRYQQTAPMATYLATVQIGRYSVIDQPGPVPLRVVAPTDITGNGFDATFGRQPQMMRFFVDRFGPYPFASYTSVITDDELEIPLESQSLATFGRNFADDDWHAIRLVAHEMAHQWFGNAVTLRTWKDIWLHEGFACYAEWLWSEESGEKSAAERAAIHHARLAELDQDLLLGDPTPELMFDDRVYKRGALTLHALRLSVGDHAFFDILRSWVTTHNGGSVTTREFIDHCSSAAGRPLDALFGAWLFTTALPPLPQ